MTEAQVLPDSIQLMLPEGWVDFPLADEDYTAWVQDLLDRASGADGVRRSDLRQIELVVAQVRQLARSQNVIMASGFLAIDQPGAGSPDAGGDAADEAEGAEPDGAIVLAGLTASALRRSDLDTDVPLHPDVLISAFAGRTSRGETTYDEIEPPTKVTVAGREAVKLTRLMRNSDGHGRELSQFALSYLVPVTNGDGLVVLQFTTINLEYAPQFAELFERIAGTLRLLFPDDPTFLPDPDAAEPPIGTAITNPPP